MNRDDCITYLESKLNDYRFQHSLGTEQTAMELARRFGFDEEQAGFAGLMHDCSKWMDDAEYLARAENYGFEVDVVSKQCPKLLHGVASAHVLKYDLGITDQEILDAVCYHCIPRLDPTGLDMIIKIADVIEPGRKFGGVDEVREIAKEDLSSAYIATLAFVIEHVVKFKEVLNVNTVQVYNEMIMDEKKDK